MNVSTDRPPKTNVPASICTVAQVCGPGATGVAIYIHDTRECWVLCQGRTAPVDRPQLSLEARVSVEAKDFDRARLGEFLASFCEAELFIPALTATEQVTLTMRDTTLSAAIERVGLVVGTGLSGKSSIK
jgi:hypothetical protein